MSTGSWGETLSAFEGQLDGVEEALEPLLSRPVNEIKSKLSPVQGAKVDLLLAYAMDSAFWMYLCTQGISPFDHPVKAELERVKEYMHKLKELEEGPTQDVGQAKLNKEAAERFITAALNEDEREKAKTKKRDKLDRQSGKKKKRKKNKD